MTARRSPRTLVPATALLSAFLAVGCVAAPGSSLGPPSSATPTAAPSPSAAPSDTPTPTASPSGTPSASPSGAPSASPSGTPAASGSPSASPSGSASACGVGTWATGPKDLVLRIAYGGGLVMPGTDLTSLPTISVYGDGTVLTPGAVTAIYPGPLVLPLGVQKLNDAGMRALLDAAAKAGLLVPDTSYPQLGIADASTTFFTLTADGCTHRISAYALMQDVSTQGLDQATIDARKKLYDFSVAVTNLPDLVGAANVTDGGLYQPTAYRIVVRPGSGTDGNGSPLPVVAWPLPKTPLATFGDPLATGMPDYRCGVVDGADAATLAPVLAQANQETQFRSGGKVYALMARPQLPDETGCDFASM